VSKNALTVGEVAALAARRRDEVVAALASGELVAVATGNRILVERLSAINFINKSRGVSKS
jgi:hypothetical protein